MWITMYKSTYKYLLCKTFYSCLYYLFTVCITKCSIFACAARDGCEHGGHWYDVNDVIVIDACDEDVSSSVTSGSILDTVAMPSYISVCLRGGVWSTPPQVCEGKYTGVRR